MCLLFHNASFLVHDSFTTTTLIMRATVLISALCLLFLAALCPVSAVPYANSGSLSKRYASPVIVARGAPSPSPSPRPHKIDFDFDFIRVPKVPTRKKFDARDQEQEIVMSPSEASQHLCPQPMTVCPITPNSAPSTLSEWDRDGFECVDTEEDLTSCGGCGFLDATCVLSPCGLVPLLTFWSHCQIRLHCH